MGTYVSWKKLFSVGDDSIDAQHKQILSIINSLHNAIQDEKEYSVIEGLLERMLCYTKTHFQHEEQLMRACGYPDYENHKALHDQMQRRIAGLHANSNLVTGFDLMRFLKEWWINHIRGEDQCYVPYLSAMTQKQSLPGVPTQAVGPIDWNGQTTVR